MNSISYAHEATHCLQKGGVKEVRGVSGERKVCGTLKKELSTEIAKAAKEAGIGFFTQKR